MSDIALRVCPGWDKKAHALPATLEYFYHCSREDKPGGIVGLSGYCKVCTRMYAVYQRQQWRKRRDTRKANNEAKVAHGI
jgi:hypothetical protein